MYTLYAFAVVLVLMAIGVAYLDYLIHHYRYKAGRRYRRYTIQVAGQDYILWIPERRKR